MPPRVNPEMLIFARELRGMTQKELAESSQVSQSNVSRYENELVDVAADDLSKLSRALGFPIKFFYREDRIYSPDTPALFHRKQRTMSKKDQARIDRLLDLHRARAADLLRSFDLEPPFFIPHNIEIKQFGSVSEVAAQVRALWKVPLGPVRNLVQLLEDASCLIFVADFGTDKMDEVTQWIEPSPPIILVNSRAPGDRLRFNLAHALGHLVLHHNRLLSDEKQVEAEADEFAASFLMPADDIIPELKPVSIEHMIQLKQRWKVSIQALVRRALDLNVITERRYTSLYTQLSKAGYRKREPGTVLIERPQLVKQLLTAYQTVLDYSDEDLANMLDLHVQDYRRWYKDDPYLKVVEREDKRHTG